MRKKYVLRQVGCRYGEVISTGQGTQVEAGIKS